MTRQAIVTDELAAPVGPFSVGLRVEDFVYLSGQVAQDPRTGRLIEGGVGAQTEQIFKNLEVLLRTSGKSFADVIKVTVFLTSIADFPAVNEIYARQFDRPYPARTTVAVVALPLGAAVEMEVMAR
jgi:2-iminobutanoate/2-iminopropanoate deaminase